MVVCLSQMFILFSLSQRVNSAISWMTTNSRITFLFEHDNMVASLISNTFICEPLRSTEVSLGHVWWLPSYKPHIEGDKHQEYLTKTHSNPSDFQSYIAWIQNAYSLKIKSCIELLSTGDNSNVQKLHCEELHTSCLYKHSSVKCFRL